KRQEAQRFGVDARSIQRDIDDIRAFLCDRRENDVIDTREIVYDRERGGFVLIGGTPSMMTNSEILAVSKILLESRAFTMHELTAILDKLVEGCAPSKDRELVSDLIANEKFHYVEPNHREYLQDKLWDLGISIHEHQLVTMRYARAGAPEESIKRVVEPRAILFSEYYFYLNAFIVERGRDGKYVHKYSYPTIFRIDRIKSYAQLGEKFPVSYADRFEEGEFRKRIQFMYAGSLMNIRLKYDGDNPEPILDRLPTARIVEQSAHACIIEAQVYGKGILMWLLSQKSNVEVLGPKRLREEMKETLTQMLRRYQQEMG
ncbi:MAG: WYL domain-containing protein, partial [Lachnospiraceae bacterium]|nr:WYL domain-containing protein [Lachnospiraceae bacterium]